MSLQGIKQVLGEARKYEPDMSVNQLLCFLLIGEHNGSEYSMSELRREMGITQSTVSRYCQALSKVNRHKQPGLNWIRYEQDPKDFRVKLLSLTVQGKKVYDDLKRLGKQ